MSRGSCGARVHVPGPTLLAAKFWVTAQFSLTHHVLEQRQILLQGGAPRGEA